MPKPYQVLWEWNGKKHFTYQQLAESIFGVCSLVSATLASWYSSLQLASLWEWNGMKHFTYQQLAESIFGSWGYWSMAFCQQVASLGNNIAIQIAAGSSLKAIYKFYDEDGKLTLQHFIAFFGAFELIGQDWGLESEFGGGDER